jgi:hypothetical protein
VSDKVLDLVTGGLAQRLHAAEVRGVGLDGAQFRWSRIYEYTRNAAFTAFQIPTA